MYCSAVNIRSDVELIPARYSNNRLAITLDDPLTGERWGVATVNIPDAVLMKDEIILKDWSENEGMVNFFIENGLVEDTGRLVPTGHVLANVVRMTDKLKEMLGVWNE